MDHPATPPPPPRRIGVIACAVMELELHHLAADVPNLTHLDVLEQGLHNEPDKLRLKLQEAVDRAERNPEVDALALVYGLCSRGIEGLRPRRVPMAVARAHDCITLLLGCRHRYARYAAEHPGTYWYSPGWNKHHIPPGKDRYDRLYRKYAAQFGEEDAKYLMESEQAWFATYHRATYVDLGIGATDRDLAYTKECADWLGWQMDRQHGDPGLMRALLAGEWDDDRFVVLQPGQSFRMTADERIIEPHQGQTE